MESLIPVSRPKTYNAVVLGMMMRSIMDSGWLTNNGPNVLRFEYRVCERLRVPHFVAMANGTLALEAAISHMFNPGDAVAIPSFTFVAVASALVRCGCEPVFVDIEPGSWTMSYDRAMEVADDVAGFIVANVFGEPPDDRFSRLSMLVIYDNAEGFGSSTGVFGDLDVYSFHATKSVSCAEGGGVACMVDDTRKDLAQWRDFGISGPNMVSMVGTNAKMSEFHARLGTESLLGEAWQVTERVKILRWYKEMLSGVVEFQESLMPQNCVILTRRKSAVMCALQDNGVDSREYFYPIHLMKPYKQFQTGPLRVTESVASRSLAIPMWGGLSEKTVGLICDVIREVHG